MRICRETGLADSGDECARMPSDLDDFVVCLSISVGLAFILRTHQLRTCKAGSLRFDIY